MSFFGSVARSLGLGWVMGGVRGGEPKKKKHDEAGEPEPEVPDGGGELLDEVLKQGNEGEADARAPKKRRNRSGISLVGAKLSAGERASMLHALFTAAYTEAKSQGRQRLTSGAQEKLLRDFEACTGEKVVDFAALRKRYYRAQDNGAFERKPGSGRKHKMTDEMVEMVKEILQSYNYECSYQQAYEDFMVKMRDQGREEEAPKQSTFLKFVAESRLFKLRRKRCLPHVTEDHKAARIAYAKKGIDSGFVSEDRTVFSDEKLFTGTPAVTLRMPVEVKTPEHRVKSKSNPVKVMMQVVLMTPRGDFDGVVASHAYTEVKAAQRKSVNRPKGTPIESNVNVDAENYVAAWRDTILPRLKELIKEGKIDAPTSERPLLLQDDNARPHRSDKANPELICSMAKEKFGIEMQPVDPLQPAQSPDLNPLDTFFFRLLFVRFRRLRAQARVQLFAAMGSRAAEEHDVSSDPEEDGLNEAADEVEVLSEEEEEEKEEETVVRRRIPLLCKAPSKGRGVCPGCRKHVNLGRQSVKCAARGGYWHLDCAREAIVAEVQGAKGPSDEMDDDWVCYQCVHHLCTNRGEQKRTRCIKCNLPSKRSGEDMGTDMVVCDRKEGGLYHKTCIGYNEAEEEEDGEQLWLCPLCEDYAEDVEYDEEVESLETAWENRVVPNLGANSVEALHLAVDEAIKEIPRQKIERGFETRRQIIKRVYELNGNNEKTSHWRNKRPRDDGNGA